VKVAATAVAFAFAAVAAATGDDDEGGGEGPNRGQFLPLRACHTTTAETCAIVISAIALSDEGVP